MSESDSAFENRVASIFLCALEAIGSKERCQYLDTACGHDARLRQAVDGLLAAHEEAGDDFLEQQVPNVEPTVGSTHSHTPSSSNANHSVLKSLCKTISKIPNVTLPGSQDNDFSIVDPRSNEIPPVRAEDRYQLLGEIARGGMGAIIKGRDTDLGRDLALKVLLDSHSNKPELISRFIEEAQIGGQLQHPSIVPVYELGQFDDQRPFFTMKLVKGHTLAAMLSNRNSPQDELSKILGVFEQICQAIGYAHSKSVIHRDLKPANVMVGSFGEVLVMDWGLSKVLKTGGVADEIQSAERHRDVSVVETRRSVGSDVPGSNGSDTLDGSIMGTPAYMPPEQAHGEVDRLDQRTDVFSLGAILAEILTGKPPYIGESRDVLRLARRGTLDGCFERLDACGAESGLIELCKKSLSVEPAQRFRNAKEMADSINQYFDTVRERLKQAELDRVEAETRSREESRRNKLYLVLAATMAGVAFLGAMLAVASRRNAESQRLAALEASQRASEREQARDNADRLRNSAEIETRRANALRYVAQSQVAAESFPVRSALLAREAVNATREKDGIVLPSAKEALLNATVGLHGPPLAVGGGNFDVSPDNRWLVALDSSKNFPVVWRLEPDAPARLVRELSGHTTRFYERNWQIQFLDNKRVLTFAVDGARLWDLSVPSRAPRVFSGFEDLTAKAVAVSDDLKWLAIGGDKGTVRTWNLNDSSSQVFEKSIPNRSISKLCFSPDAQRLATSSVLTGADGNASQPIVQVWDVGNRSEESEKIFKLPGGRADDLAFSSDGRSLFTSGKLSMWDLESEGEHQVTDLASGDASRIAFSPNGGYLAVGVDGEVRLWKVLQDGTVVGPQPIGEHVGKIVNLEFSSDGNWLAASSQFSAPSLWDMRADDVRTSRVILHGHENNVKNLHFDQGCSVLYTGDFDGIVRRWDLEASHPSSNRMLLAPSRIKTIVLSADEKWLAASMEGTPHRMCLWKFEPESIMQQPIILHGGNSPGYGRMQISPKGRWLATKSDKSLLIWDLHGDPDGVRDSVREIVGHEGEVKFLKFGPNEEWLASSSLDRTLRLWNLRDPSAAEVVLDHFYGAGFAISPDRSWLVAATLQPGGNSEIHVWDFREAIATTDRSRMEPTHVFKLPEDSEPLNFCTFSSNSQEVVFTTALGRIVVLRFGQEGEDLQPRFLGTKRIAYARPAVFAPDNKMAMTAGEASELYRWDISDPNAAEPQGYRAHSDSLKCIACDKDKRILVTGAFDKTARVWSFDNLDEPPIVLGSHESGVKSVAVSSEGRWIVTASGRTIRIFDMDIDSNLARIESSAGRDFTNSERAQYSLPGSDKPRQ